MQLVERKLTDLSQLRSRIYGVLDREHDTDVQVVAFEGSYGVGSRGNPDAAFMRAVVAQAAEAWNSIALVLDLRELEYSWGNSLLGVIQAAEQLHGGEDHSPFPVKLVVSDKCRDGLLSLLGTTADAARGTVFGSLEAAIVAAREDGRLYLDQTGQTSLPD
jgi:hypothetical protein